MALPPVVYLKPFRWNEFFKARPPHGQNEELRKKLFRNVGAGPNHRGTVVFPPSTDSRLNYFEIKIIAKRSDTDCPIVGIGVGPPDYKVNRFPGWNMHSVGYHSDDGHLFHSHGQHSRPNLGPTCAVGDVMGCGVVFEDLAGHAMVWFTKNGRVVGRPERAKIPPGGLCTMFASEHGEEEVLYLGHKQWMPAGEYAWLLHSLRPAIASSALDNVSISIPRVGKR